MDTGYVNQIDEGLRIEVLDRARAVLEGRPFLAGAFVGDRAGSPWDREAYLRQVESVVNHGGTPVIFQSHGLTALGDDEIIDAYAGIGRHCDRFVAFELGTAFAPFGRIYSLEVYRGLLGIKSCVGAKHSSLLPRARVAPPDRARPAPARFSGLHRERPGHRHGDVRQRLSPGPEQPSPPTSSPSVTLAGGR